MGTNLASLFLFLLGGLLTLVGIVTFIRKAPRDIQRTDADRRHHVSENRGMGWFTAMTDMVRMQEGLHKGSSWASIVYIAIGLLLIVLGRFLF